MTCSLGQWAVNSYGQKALFLNGVWMLLVSLPSLVMLHSKTISPSMYLMLSGFVLGGCESMMLAVLMDMNDARDRVTMAALYMMTASVGASLGDMIEQLFMATAQPLVLGGAAWIVGCMLILGASSAASRDAIQREKRNVLNVVCADYAPK